MYVCMYGLLARGKRVVIACRPSVGLLARGKRVVIACRPSVATACFLVLTNLVPGMQMVTPDFPLHQLYQSFQGTLNSSSSKTLYNSLRYLFGVLLSKQSLFWSR